MCGLCGEKWPLGLDFFTTEITMSAQRAQRGYRNGQVRKGKERKAEGSRLRVVPSFCGIRLDIL